MSFKKIWLTISAVIIALIVGVLIGYFVGTGQAKSRAEAEQKAKEEAFNSAEAAYKAELELNIQLNRSELEGLGKIEGPIYVTGHKVPDSDTVCSSIAYAALLQKMGYDAQAVVLGEINNETKFILEQAGVDTPPLLEDASGCNMILIDHSEYTQSANGLEDANIITIIDHHGAGSVTTGNPLIYDARPIGATATIVWMRYRNYGFVPDKQIAFALTGAILSDTQNFKSNSTTAADIVAVGELAKLAEMPDTNAFFQEQFKASISYGDMTDEEIFFSDYKNYAAGSRQFGIGVINVYDEDDAKTMATRMKAIIPAVLQSTGSEMAFAQISIFHDDINITYLVPSDEGAAEAIEAIYGDIAIYDGTSYILDPGVSRKKDLVPAITDFLEAHPKE
ncbi:MAG: DHH family phosphoesterase [Lachnospiraceae bacterium]|nr:DHH family phosphoesterase [Lachnospiraceae bacterium]